MEPEEIGLRRASPEEIRGGSPEKNAQIVLNILKGERGSRRHVVLLNAAALFVAAEKARDFKDGIELAKESIDSGRALKKLAELISFSQDPKS